MCKQNLLVTQSAHKYQRNNHRLNKFLDNAYAQAVWDPQSQKMLEYKDLIRKDAQTKLIWEKSYANELGRLSQGVRDIEGSNCIRFISKHEVPNNRQVTYGRHVVDYRPTKSDPNRSRLTIGGNLLTYDGNLYTETTDIITTKMLLNSVLSTPGAKFMTVDIKNFYLGTPMSVYELSLIHI